MGARLIGGVGFRVGTACGAYTLCVCSHAAGALGKRDRRCRSVGARDLGRHWTRTSEADRQLPAPFGNTFLLLSWSARKKIPNEGRTCPRVPQPRFANLEDVLRGRFSPCRLRAMGMPL